MKKEFAIAKEGFLDGVHRTIGEKVWLTEKQAEHLLISGQIVPVAERVSAAPAPAPDDAPAKTKK